MLHIEILIPKRDTDFHDHENSSADNWWSVCPAWIAKNDGGPTPKNVPNQNGNNGTSMQGATMFINQFGKNGVIRKNNM